MTRFLAGALLGFLAGLWVRRKAVAEARAHEAGRLSDATLERIMKAGG